MLEVCCHGADLSGVPKGRWPLAPFVEVVLDGFKVGQTRRHEHGDQQPRWEESFPVAGNGLTLRFSVGVKGPRDDVKVGEAKVDLRALLRQQPEGQRSLTLISGTTRVGTLRFSWKPLRSQRNEANDFMAGGRNVGGYPSGGSCGGVQGVYPNRPARPSVPLQDPWQSDPYYIESSPSYYKDEVPGEPPWEQIRAPQEIKRWPAAALPVQTPGLPKLRESTPQLRREQDPLAGPGVPRVISEPSKPTYKEYDPARASAMRRASSTSTTDATGQRLQISEQGKGAFVELMSSKDKLHEYAERPFKARGLDTTARLSYPDFQQALTETLADLQMMSMPDEKQVRALFEKHRRGTEGVGCEEFEALLFRLLCYLRASNEVNVEMRRTPSNGEERDKRWRQEFIQKNPRKFSEVYDIEKQLGKGSFGTVYMVAHKTQRDKRNEKRVRVCKIITKKKASRAGTSDAKVREEFAVLKQLDHPHVLRIFEDFEDDENFYLIMEPCRGGDLQEYLRRLEPMDAASYEFWVAKVMQHTLSALAYCHSKAIIHKDLKPENVMLSTDKHVHVRAMHVVVVDFGLAEVFENPADRSTVVSGTPPYMAPEVWRGDFSKSCDIWSVGCMLFFLLSGRLPFMASRVEDFPKAIQSEPDWSLMGGASEDARKICKLMLKKEEYRRPTAQHALKDRWFQNQNLLSRHGSGAQALDSNQRKSLLSVAERSHFEKFVTRLVATQVDASQQVAVNEAFRAFDTDGDGRISREELRQGLSVFGATPQQIEEVVDGLDIGRTGQISYTEFLAGVIGLRGKKPEEQDKLLWIAWQQFCPDTAGRVKTSSVKDALASRGMTVADLPEQFIAVLAKKQSEYITFEEFKSLLVSDESGEVMRTLAGDKCRGPKMLRWLFGKMK